MPRHHVQPTEIATAAIAAEERARTALEALPGARAAARRIAEVDSRADRRAALWSVLERSRGDRSAAARAARRAWEEATRRCWELALSGRSVADFEVRRRRPGGATGAQDLAQEARIGLFDAACRFEPGRGASFSTYARWWVRARLNRATQHGTPGLRVPDSALRDLRRLMEARRVLAGRGREPSTEQAAELAEIDPARAEQLEGLAHPQSLDTVPASASSSSKAQLRDPGADPGEWLERRRRRDRIRSLVKSVLSERDRVVISRRYGLAHDSPESFREIGEALEISGERARQLHGRALRSLRQHLSPGA